MSVNMIQERKKKDMISLNDVSGKEKKKEKKSKGVISIDTGFLAQFIFWRIQFLINTFFLSHAPFDQDSDQLYY